MSDPELDAKKALGAVGYYEREAVAAAESVAGAHRKLEKAQRDLADAEAGIGTAEAEQETAQARLAEARSIADAYGEQAGPGASTGVGAGDPTIQIEEN